MGRKILFITTDQQRYDTLGCNGGTLSRTPVIDALASDGIRYERAVPQSDVSLDSATCTRPGHCGSASVSAMSSAGSAASSLTKWRGAPSASARS